MAELVHAARPAGQRRRSAISAPVTAIVPSTGRRNRGCHGSTRAGQLVHRREIDRPEELPGIEPERVSGERDARARPVLVVRSDVAALLTRDHRDDARGDTEERVRHLFPHQRPPADREAPQRIHVEQQERERQRHRDGLRRERGGERRDGECPPPAGDRTAPGDAAQVHEHGEQVERAAQEVAPPADPRDGFGAQRMHAEDERARERAEHHRRLARATRRSPRRSAVAPRNRRARRSRRGTGRSPRW